MHIQDIAHPSGITTLFVEQHAAPVVALQVWVRVGSGDERPHEAGLAHVHEHMLFKGTATRGVGQIAREIESLGGSINAWTSFDQTVYHIVLPSRFFEHGLDVLLDAVQHSAFEAGELERELEVIQEEIRRGEDMPTRVLSQAMFREAFHTHPYGLPVIGTSASVDSFTREDVVAFFERWYRPENMTLVVAGDVDQDTITGALDRFMDAGQPPLEPREDRAEEAEQRELRAFVLNRQIQEGHLNIAFHTPGLHHEDTPALDVLLMLFGQGESSILFEHIQRRDRLTNGVYGFLYSPADPGLAVLGASFAGQGELRRDPETVLRAMIREVAHLHHRELGQDDIDRAIALMRSNLIYDRQTVQGIAQRVGYFHTVAGDADFEARFVEIAQAVTPAQLREMAVRYFTPENMTVGFMLPEGDGASLTRDRIRAIVDEVFADVAREYAPVALEADAHGIIQHQIPDGPLVLISPDTTSPVFSMRAIVPGGLLAETEGDNGVHNLIAELMTAGTQSRDAAEIARELDRLAASIAGFSGRNSLGVRMTALSEHFDASVDLFADVVWAPAFPEDELDRVRDEVLATIAARQDDLASTVFRRFNALAFEGHPYAMSVLGTDLSLGRIDRDRLVATYEAVVRPERMIVSVVGDVDPDRVIRELTARFVVPREGEAAADTRVAHDWTPVEAPVVQEELRDRQQAHIVMGFQTVSMFDDDRMALDVLAAILGGQGGRLFLTLRDQQSLAYSVGAYATHGWDAGTFAFYIATRPERREEAIEGLRAAIAEVQADGVTDEELERAQRYLLGRRDISLQQLGVRASLLGFDAFYGLGYDHQFGFEDRVMGVTLEDIQRVAATYLDADRELLTVLRPGAGETPAR